MATSRWLAQISPGDRARPSRPGEDLPELLLGDGLDGAAASKTRARELVVP